MAFVSTGNSSRTILGALPGNVFSGGKTVFGPVVSGVLASSVFGPAPISPFGGPQTYFGPTPGITEPVNNVPDTFDSTQFKLLTTIRENYSKNLATKNYEKIPSSITKYLALLHSLQKIKITNANLLLLIQVVSNVLTGSLNANSLYSSYAYNEIAIITLTKRIQEILSNINVINTSKGEGQFTAVKTVRLSPIFNYYIHLYGMPEPGVGFDMNKLAFLKTIPAVQERILAENMKAKQLMEQMQAKANAKAKAKPDEINKPVNVTFAPTRPTKPHTNILSEIKPTIKEVTKATPTISNKLANMIKRKQQQKQAYKPLQFTKTNPE
mgnify:CR=1 FL=1